ncbi:T9SS type A sorting domain-containing protein [Rasiella rasia]|uniref:T9SS type A sorting domain-containing protein n=1 Tax=Rasiella rasia TaxID=2744027 RepID=A0A6G6GQH8_9FLAO|nr:M36 family metallopeptidase [Rasiella rasia]QIE59971.1 T9SS type A sorting domain-containing protein [Rasiella rasia]
MKKFYLFAVLLGLLGSSTFAQTSVESVVQNYFNILKGESHFSEADLAQFKITDIVPSLNQNITHVYVQQMVNNVPIQYASYKLTINNGTVTYMVDQFITNTETKLATTSAAISAQEAVMKTVQNHNLIRPTLIGSRNAEGVYVFEDSRAAGAPIKVREMYQLHNNTLRLVWNVSFYQHDGQHWWNENIDATNGQVLRTEDWVITCNWGDTHETHNHDGDSMLLEELPTVEGPANFLAGESYNVYAMPKESPLDGGRTVVNDPQDLNASPYGWHDTNGANGAEYTITRGNNCWAMEDANGNNGTGYSPNGNAGLDFNFPINFNNQPSTYRDAAITNLFYWNNIMHDVYYQYGFNEASGNFQENNYGNGGLGSDSVIADAQDGSGTNNANFGTPPDGSNPRMQMFLWTTTNPQTDGDFDNGIIAHEYGHGISTRLVGGPGTNALGGSEQMGEGWSDFFGLMLTMKTGDSGGDARGIGNFALGENSNGGGIRPTPYSTNTSINGTTYADINSLAVPHGVGYAWATILWDMNWALIAQEGFDTDFYNGTGGNNIAMALVIEGLKNTANNPGFVSGRDGILQADQDLYGGQYNCLIWDVFAARGVGLNANENTNGGTNTNTDQTTSFVSGCQGPPTPEACSGTVSSYPDSESFESNFGDWSQSTQDDLDWTRDSAGTPSSNTGPASGADGSFYVYVEASSPNYPNKRAILYSPCYDLSGQNDATFNFSYHMYGAADMGSIDLEVSTDDGTSWTSIWNQTGNKGNQWNAESIDLGSYAGENNFRMRFNRVTGSTWQADIALDAFEMEGGSVADTQAPTIPTNLAVSNIADTSVTLNWNASNDNVGVTGYEVFLDGSSIGTVASNTANVTGLVAGTTYSFQVRAFDAAGNNSALSNSVNATTTGGGGGGGCTNGVATGYSESFESSIGAWTQSTADDINWTRDASGTPSSNTGPSSGSPGSFYMYVEASGSGTGYPNKRAILNSPCIDLSGETEASFSFNYHMYGASDMGSIALEASTDGASWTSIWSETGNKGNQWNSSSVSLNAYAGGTVQLRFNRLTGSTWQADIAIDGISLTAGGGGGGPAPTGYCASNGNNTSDEYIQRVQIGSINNASGASSGGYGDYTSLSTNLSSSNSITITPLWTGTIYSEGYAVFVDWNRDGDFTDSGELAYSRNATTATPITGSFSIPSGASAGATRMRVSMKYNGIPSACESFTYGEVEDYTVVIPASFGPNGGANAQGDNNLVVAGFTLYPNPVNRGTLNVEISEAEPTDYVIFNIIGQRVLSGDFNSKIDVSGLQSGMYMIEINAEDGKKFIDRFIKE